MWVNALLDDGYVSIMSPLPNAQRPAFMRVYRGMDAKYVISRMNLHQLLEENAGMEQFVVKVVGEMLSQGVHDDSDYRSQVLCLYIPLINQADLKEAYTLARKLWIDERPAAASRLSDL